MFSQEILKNENSKKLKKTVTCRSVYILAKFIFFKYWVSYDMILTEDENR